MVKHCARDKYGCAHNVTLPKIPPCLAEEVMWPLKKGGGLILECFDIPPKSTCTPTHYTNPPTINMRCNLGDSNLYDPFRHIRIPSPIRSLYQKRIASGYYTMPAYR